MKFGAICLVAAFGFSIIGCKSGDATEITPPKTVVPPAADQKAASKGLSPSDLGPAPGADKMKPGSKAGN